MMATLKIETIFPVCAKEKVDHIKQQSADEKKMVNELEIKRLLTWANIQKNTESMFNADNGNK